MTTLPLSNKTWPVPPRSDRARLLSFIKRKEGLSKEEFFEYFYKKHVPAMLEVMPKPGFLKLHLMEINDEINAILAGYGAKTMQDYDAAMIIEAPSWDDLFKVRNDEKFFQARMEDEAHFIDISATMPIPLAVIPFLDN
ncbi:hypothetical protein CYLTODRAFT_421243 [Cylindrobasidium torrendii FP15055 ss-10]|uniref:EthD domain-containing protein n=1 Tax=Cylindrobasidium torrendii FP15055 ss-10 TaxID=1314674 RepID=A0A0D7BEI1_9AGAR|nr:hypothetical protein CYLTODRAFT_421243 [Cylindrobasidium torrendii FP15055 ss-10]